MAYSVYILEDEDWLRAYLKKIIPWKELGLSFAGETQNGITAFHDLLKLNPDIFLCDIKVPGLNGLDVIQKALTEHPHMKIIIISGYQSFDYAKEAIDLGVKAFLSKPVKKTDLLHTLEKVIHEINIYKEKKEFLSHAKNAYYVQLLEDTSENIIAPEIFPKNQAYCVCFSIYEKNHSSELYEKIDQTLRILSTNQLYAAFYQKLHGEFGIIFSFFDQSTHYHQIESILKQIDYSTDLSEPLHWAIGECVTDYHDIPLSYHSAQMTWMYHSLHNSAQFYYYDPSIIHDFTLLNQEITDQLVSLIHTPDPGKRNLKLNQLLKEIFEKNHLTQLDYVHNIFYFCFKTIDRINLHGASAQLFYEKCADLLKHQYSYYSPEKLKLWFVKFIEQLSEEHQKSQSRTMNVIVEEVRQYIDTNFCKELSLTECAEMYRVNPAYLSTSFKKNTGCNFIEYLTKKRLEKSIYYLSHTELPINDISNLVGYQNTKYFSHSFRKIYGFPPTEYRAKLKKEDLS